MDLKEFHAASDYNITRDNYFSMEGQFTKKKLNTSTITENKRHFFIWKDNVQQFLFILAQSQREGGNQKNHKRQGTIFLSMQGQITKIKCFQIQQARIQ